MNEPVLSPKSPSNQGKMLPGIAGIAVFMLVLTLLNVFGAMQNAFGDGAGKYGVLGLCTMLVAGLFGLLRMKRFGWALVCGGCILLSGGYFYARRPVEALLTLVFFLYLVRPEVRDRML